MSDWITHVNERSSSECDFNQFRSADDIDNSNSFGCTYTPCQRRHQDHVLVIIVC